MKHRGCSPWLIYERTPLFSWGCYSFLSCPISVFVEIEKQGLDLGVDGNFEAWEVTYQNGVLSKIDLASRFPKRPKKYTKFSKVAKVRKRPQKNVVYLGFPGLSFAVFSFDLRQCVKYLWLSSTGQMFNDFFFETKNDALSMVWQRVS